MIECKVDETLEKLLHTSAFIAIYFPGLAGEVRHHDHLAGPAISFPSFVPLERGIPLFSDC